VVVVTAQPDTGVDRHSDIDDRFSPHLGTDPKPVHR